MYSFCVNVFVCQCMYWSVIRALVLRERATLAAGQSQIRWFPVRQDQLHRLSSGQYVANDLVDLGDAPIATLAPRLGFRVYACLLGHGRCPECLLACEPAAALALSSLVPFLQPSRRMSSWWKPASLLSSSFSVSATVWLHSLVSGSKFIQLSKSLLNRIIIFLWVSLSLPYDDTQQACLSYPRLPAAFCRVLIRGSSLDERIFPPDPIFAGQDWRPFNLSTDRLESSMLTNFQIVWSNLYAISPMLSWSGSLM